jgi:ABC-type uncharacterized transport system permease subunit
VNDTHIIGPTSNVLFVYPQLQEEFGAFGLLVQLMKRVTWSPQGLNQSISLLPSFFTLKFGLHIPNVPMSFWPFVESFVLEAFQEDLNTIASLPMLIDPRATYVMFSFYYGQQPSYL